MIKEYIVKYKVFSISYYYEFKCFAETPDKAIMQFIKKETLIGIERFYIAAETNI